jgi:hypothetical protein
MLNNTKKKLYISCPMKGRTEEAIRRDMDRMHKVAEIVFDQELEVIPTYVKHDPPETGNKAIWCLGESIKKMAEADYFIGVVGLTQNRGCEVEAHVAHAYEVRCTFVNADEFMPEVLAADRIAYAQEMEAKGNIMAPMPVCC